MASHLTHADRGDAASGPESMSLAQKNLTEANVERSLEEVVADKGYHSNEMLAHCQECEVRTYIPEPKATRKRRWTDKPPEYERAYRNNRRRTQGAKGQHLSRWRSERVERTFAHVCEIGGSRRSWLRGLENVRKVHQIKCAGYNLGLYLRRAFGLRKPRNLSKGPMNAKTTASTFIRLTTMVRINALCAA